MKLPRRTPMSHVIMWLVLALQGSPIYLFMYLGSNRIILRRPHKSTNLKLLRSEPTVKMSAPAHLISKVADPIFAVFIGLGAAAVRINREEKELGHSPQQTIEAGLRYDHNSLLVSKITYTRVGGLVCENMTRKMGREISYGRCCVTRVEGVAWICSLWNISEGRSNKTQPTYNASPCFALCFDHTPPTQFWAAPVALHNSGYQYQNLLSPTIGIHTSKYLHSVS